MWYLGVPLGERRFNSFFFKNTFKHSTRKEGEKHSTQAPFTCSKLIIETPEQGVKYNKK